MTRTRAGAAGDPVLTVRTTTGDVMHGETAVGQPPAQEGLKLAEEAKGV